MESEEPIKKERETEVKTFDKSTLRNGMNSTECQVRSEVKKDRCPLDMTKRSSEILACPDWWLSAGRTSWPTLIEWSQISLLYSPATF